MDNKQKKLTLLGILLAGCLLASMAGEWTRDERDADAAALAPPYVQQEAARQATIKVYVSGAVLQPGIYDLPPGSRAWEAVEAAGGLREDANADKVNMAKKLKDGNHVNVPVLKAAAGKNSPAYGGEFAAGTRAEKFSVGGGRVNINTATAAELDALPGIGPAMARRIIERRQQKRFTQAEDLLQVKGMGRAKLERLKNLIEVN